MSFTSAARRVPARGHARRLVSSGTSWPRPRSCWRCRSGGGRARPSPRCSSRRVRAGRRAGPARRAARRPGRQPGAADHRRSRPGRLLRRDGVHHQHLAADHAGRRCSPPGWRSRRRRSTRCCPTWPGPTASAGRWRSGRPPTPSARSPARPSPGVLVGAFGLRVPLLIDAATYLAVVAAGLLLHTRRKAAVRGAGRCRVPPWRIRNDRFLLAMICLVGGHRAHDQRQHGGRRLLHPRDARRQPGRVRAGRGRVDGRHAGRWMVRGGPRPRRRRARPHPGPGPPGDGRGRAAVGLRRRGVAAVPAVAAGRRSERCGEQLPRRHRGQARPGRAPGDRTSPASAPWSTPRT